MTGGSGSSTIPIYIALAHPAAASAIDQARVQVRITTATVRHALAVPVTALVGLGHGRFAVDTIGAHHTRRVTPVTVGLVDDAKGLVQVFSPILIAGQQLALAATSTQYAARTPASQGRVLPTSSVSTSARLID